MLKNIFAYLANNHSHYTIVDMIYIKGTGTPTLHQKGWKPDLAAKKSVELPYSPISIYSHQFRVETSSETDDVLIPYRLVIRAKTD